jgi:ubiquinone/menaquinone biosynthesis C-methylase UbiE
MDTKKHFNNLSPIYKTLRTTDEKPVKYISKQLANIPNLKMADIGCGDGRYDELLIKRLSNLEILYCVDTNKKMLQSLESYFLGKNISRYKIVNSTAENMPFEKNSLNTIVSFNALHHFDVVRFLKSADKVLKKGGYIFLYSRTKEQNKKNIWGRYFPKFNEKEIRLFSSVDIGNIANDIKGIKVQEIREFKYKRCSNLKRLIFLATNRHYSTFNMYSEKEFKESLEIFKKQIKSNFGSEVKWYDFNTLVVLKKVN